MMETVKYGRLPKAQMIWVKWHWWWFSHIWNDRLLAPRLRTRFAMTMRGANFWQAWIGPLHFGWRRPWLRGPAEQHLNQHYGDA